MLQAHKRLKRPQVKRLFLKEKIRKINKTQKVTRNVIPPMRIKVLKRTKSWIKAQNLRKRKKLRNLKKVLMIKVKIQNKIKKHLRKSLKMNKKQITIRTKSKLSN